MGNVRLHLSISKYPKPRTILLTSAQVHDFQYLSVKKMMLVVLNRLKPNIINLVLQSDLTFVPHN